jgi:hypothetical protein
MLRFSLPVFLEKGEGSVTSVQTCLIGRFLLACDPTAPLKDLVQRYNNLSLYAGGPLYRLLKAYERKAWSARTRKDQEDLTEGFLRELTERKGVLGVRFV